MDTLCAVHEVQVKWEGPTTVAPTACCEVSSPVSLAVTLNITARYVCYACCASGSQVERLAHLPQEHLTQGRNFGTFKMLCNAAHAMHAVQVKREMAMRVASATMAATAALREGSAIDMDAREKTYLAVTRSSTLHTCVPHPCI